MKLMKKNIKFLHIYYPQSKIDLKIIYFLVPVFTLDIKFLKHPILSQPLRKTRESFNKFAEIRMNKVSDQLQNK